MARSEEVRDLFCNSPRISELILTKTNHVLEIQAHRRSIENKRAEIVCHQKHVSEADYAIRPPARRERYLSLTANAG